MSTIGRAQTFSGAADGARRALHDAAHDDNEIPPAAATRRPDAVTRHRNAPITIDLRPDPPSNGDDTAYEAPRRAYGRDGSYDGGNGGNGGARRRGAREAAPEPQWTYRANPDTPFRRRSSGEIYQAVESVDTPVPHRGGIYDRRI